MQYKALIYWAVGLFVLFGLTLKLPGSEVNALLALIAFSLGGICLFLFVALNAAKAFRERNPNSEFNRDVGLTRSGYIVIGCSVGCLIIGSAIRVLQPHSIVGELFEGTAGFLAISLASLVVAGVGVWVADVLGYPVTNKKRW